MSRLHFKGGAWSNAEDQVLQAALAEYGMRDWERIASMLTKKTAAQCRDRWEKYLDPRLNVREEWSPEEEEKLIELHTLFPNKWRLISEELTRSTPARYIRPAWLCEERYNEIRDAHEFHKHKADGTLRAQSLEEFLSERRRRRGMHRPHEEKAAKADTIDGERFEKEMIDMAVSRLANQDQKKGLRKERQRQLEEASFLAKLESNRECIESNTLSMRQAKRMNKALQEDLMETGQHKVKDCVQEDYDAIEANADDEDGGGDGTFTPIDVYKNEQQAGIAKRTRVLVKDLSGKKQLTANAASGSGVGADAVTGVNYELLRQLQKIEQDAAPMLTEKLHGSGAGVGSATTWDALASGHTPETPNLDDLFASLPGVEPATHSSGDAETVLRKPRVETPQDVPQTAAKLRSTVAPPFREPSSASVNEMDLAAIEKVPRLTQRQALVAPQPISFKGIRAQQLAQARKRVEAEVCRLHHRTVAEDKELPPRQRPRSSSDDEADKDELAAAKARVEGALQYLPCTLQQETVAVPTRPVRLQQSLASVHEELRVLVAQNAAAVQTMTDRAHRRVWQVAGISFADPDDFKVRPFVSHKGSWKMNSSSGADHAVSDAGDLMRYLWKYWTCKHQRTQDELRFVMWLRQEEQYEMSRRLNEARASLRSAQEKETRLQEVYRKRRMEGKMT